MTFSSLLLTDCWIYIMLTVMGDLESVKSYEGFGLWSLVTDH